MIIRELQAGLTLNDRYMLQMLIGRGSFGEVWLAQDMLLGMDVALKIYMAFAPASQAEFKAEFRITFELHHDNLLGGMSCDVWEQRPFIVMEYCKEGSAGRWVEETFRQGDRIEEKEIWRFIRDVASGLAYLHGKSIIHRDIKPDNILIRHSGDFAITDFGLSKEMKATMRKASGNKVSGSTAYMGPELFSSSPSAVMASDIWALGATVLELATGELPFSGMGGGMQNGGAQIPNLPKRYSKKLNTVVRKMMAKETWDRPSAVQLEEWAERALAGNDPNPHPKPRKGLWIGIATLVAVMSMIFFFVFIPDNRKLKECRALEQRADAIGQEENGYREALDNYNKIMELVRDNNLNYNTLNIHNKKVELEKKIEEKVKQYEKSIEIAKKIGKHKGAYKGILQSLRKIYSLTGDKNTETEIDNYEKKLKEL